MSRRRAFVPDDDDMGATWREHRRAQQDRRAQRIGPRTDQIIALRGKGFDVKALTPYQFRVDAVLDLFPIHRRFHHLPSQQRGGYTDPLTLAIRFLRVTSTESA